MKKVISLFIIAATLFSLAACGGDNSTPDTTEKNTAVLTEEQLDITEKVDISAESVTEDTFATAESTTDEEKVTEEQTTHGTEENNLLDLDDKQAVLDFYNAAVVKTNPDKPKGSYVMGFSKDVTGGGSTVIDIIIKLVVPVAKFVLKNNESETDFVPGEGKLRLDDCQSISATRKNGIVTVDIKLKPHTDGPDGDPKNGGPSARGIGTLGSINYAEEQMGIEFERGRDTIEITYTNASIKATINEKTGKITGGTWKFDVDLLIGDATATFKKIRLTVQDLKASFYYIFTI